MASAGMCGRGTPKLTVAWGAQTEDPGPTLDHWAQIRILPTSQRRNAPGPPDPWVVLHSCEALSQGMARVPAVAGLSLTAGLHICVCTTWSYGFGA